MSTRDPEAQQYAMSDQDFNRFQNFACVMLDRAIVDARKDWGKGWSKLSPELKRREVAMKVLVTISLNSNAEGYNKAAVLADGVINLEF